jgi:hypothetical protein
VKIIDLMQAMTNGMPVMAGIPPPEFRDLADVATDGYAMSQYTFVNHTGAHVDAPAHQIARGASLGDIPLDRLVTPSGATPIGELRADVVALAGEVRDLRRRLGRNSGFLDGPVRETELHDPGPKPTPMGMPGKSEKISPADPSRRLVIEWTAQLPAVRLRASSTALRGIRMAQAAGMSAPNMERLQAGNQEPPSASELEDSVLDRGPARDQTRRA